MNTSLNLPTYWATSHDVPIIGKPYFCQKANIENNGTAVYKLHQTANLLKIDKLMENENGIIFQLTTNYAIYIVMFLPF